MKQARLLACAALVALTVGCPIPPPPVDQGVDGGVVDVPDVGQPLLDASQDSGQVLPDASHDVGQVLPDAGTLTCSDMDVARWRTAHVDPWLVSVIQGCVSNTSCAGGPPCDLADCLRERSGIGGCAECIDLEVACTTSLCADACGPAATATSCRDCMCEGGCVAEFESCQGTDLGVCPQCDEGSCEPTLLSPALIMVIIS